MLRLSLPSLPQRSQSGKGCPSRCPLWLIPVLLAGCRAGTSVHGTFEAAKWSPVLAGQARHLGGADLDFVGDAGLPANQSLWSWDGNIQISRASRDSVGANGFNLGVWGLKTLGSADFSSPLNFAGKSLSGPTDTTADFKLIKFTYEENPTVSRSGQFSAGLLGIHYLSFAVECRGSEVAEYHSQVAALVLGYRWAYFSKGLLYFIQVEAWPQDWMDLVETDTAVMDVSSGLRWFMGGGDKTALTIAYRRFELNSVMGNDRLYLLLDGAYISIHLKF